MGISSGYAEEKELLPLGELQQLDLLIKKAYRARQCEEVEVHLTKALETRMKIFGETHDEVLNGYEKLAKCWRKKGNYKKSLIFYHKLAELCEIIYYDNDYVMSLVNEMLAEVYEESGDHQKAYELYDKALIIKLSSFGAGHEEVATTYESIATVLKKLNNNEEALVYYLKAYEIYKKLYDYGHYRIKLVVRKIKPIQEQHAAVHEYETWKKADDAKKAKYRAERRAKREERRKARQNLKRRR